MSQETARFISAVLIVSLISGGFNFFFYLLFFIKCPTWGTVIMLGWAAYTVVASDVTLIATEAQTRGVAASTSSEERITICIMLCLNTAIQSMAMMFKYKDFLRERDEQRGGEQETRRKAMDDE